MRILLAKLLVAITALAIVILAVIFATLKNTPVSQSPGKTPTSPPTHTADAETPTAQGRTIFLRERCGACHSIHGQGNPRSPLDGVGTRLTEHEIRQWIIAPRTMKPGIAKRACQLSASELDALVIYLTSEQSPSQ